MAFQVYLGMNDRACAISRYQAVSLLPCGLDMTLKSPNLISLFLPMHGRSTSIW